MDENNFENIENEDFDNIVVLKNEEGEDVEFEFLDLIEYEGSNYVVLLPTDADEEDENDEVVILKEDEEDGTEEEEAYSTVEDEEVLNKVFEIFKNKFKDEFDFIEE